MSLAAAWQQFALCRATPDTFHPLGNSYALAMKLCNECPVRGPCLEYGMDIEERFPEHGRHGCWGGTRPKDREKLARAVVPTPAPTSPFPTVRLNQSPTFPVHRRVAG